MNLLIPYDIADDRRRRNIEKTLSHYGRRVNYSVFEVELTKAHFRKLVDALEEYSDKKHDHIRIYVLNKESMKKSFVVHEKEEVFAYDALYL